MRSGSLEKWDPTSFASTYLIIKKMHNRMGDCMRTLEWRWPGLLLFLDLWCLHKFVLHYTCGIPGIQDHVAGQPGIVSKASWFLMRIYLWLSSYNLKTLSDVFEMGSRLNDSGVTEGCLNRSTMTIAASFLSAALLRQQQQYQNRQRQQQQLKQKLEQQLTLHQAKLNHSPVIKISHLNFLNA